MHLNVILGTLPESREAMWYGYLVGLLRKLQWEFTPEDVQGVVKERWTLFLNISRGALSLQLT